MIRTGGNAKVRWHGLWSDWMRECEPAWTPPPLSTIDTPNFVKASLEEEAVCDAPAAAYWEEADEEAVCDALAAAYWEEADGGLGEATRKKARTTSATPLGRVRGATPAGGGGGNKKRRKPPMTAGDETGETAESGKKAKVAAADEARAERLRKRARAAGGDEARAGDGDGDRAAVRADVGEDDEPGAKAARRRGHAAEVSRANQAGQDPGG